MRVDRQSRIHRILG